jgi:hypothetical protein
MPAPKSHRTRKTATSATPARKGKRARQAKAVEANLGPVQTLAEFRATAKELTLPQRQLLVDQALVLIEHLYVHLSLKRAMHAVDPIQRLRLLRARLANMPERTFHDELIDIFHRLRDLHTAYVLPDPYRAHVAALPFRLEMCYDGERPRFLVTQVAPTVRATGFRKGVEVTHWNGIPIGRAVEINADREAGSNPDARLARGLTALTTRWMGMSLPPDEEWVIINFNDGRRPRQARFEWQVFSPSAPKSGHDVLTAAGEQAAGFGVNAKAEVERRVLKLFFDPGSIRAEQSMAERAAGALPNAETPDLQTKSLMPDVFSDFRKVKTASGTYGYVRLRTFNVTSDDAFIREFIRIVGLLPQEGLILDVRGNPGGLIIAGERLLQVLTPGPIEPERLHFVNTALTLRLCKQNNFLKPWCESIVQAIETGASFSQGFPLLAVERYNDLGQHYQGPVVLVTDASCYSTTDIFAAGFQDHTIGKVLGVSGNTGAGGANVWTHALLQEFLPGSDSPFQALPRQASFTVSVRRTTRVGQRSGVPVEDLGVVPDHRHQMTSRDVLKRNADLIETAASLLKKMPKQRLTATVEPGGSEAKLTAQNVARVDVYLDGRPLQSVDVKEGETSVALPPGATGVLELRGYRGRDLVASTRVQL